MLNATPRKLTDGTWGARVEGVERPAVGDLVTVTTLSGDSWTARVTALEAPFVVRTTGRPAHVVAPRPASVVVRDAKCSACGRKHAPITLHPGAFEVTPPCCGKRGALWATAAGDVYCDGYTTRA